ncbi:hypothetical protein GGS20DRAFT_584352 [Poronia punctata]|nr:hypothetical protein GGS20DRAFT_584352 [Poronia punctata]
MSGKTNTHILGIGFLAPEWLIAAAVDMDVIPAPSRLSTFSDPSTGRRPSNPWACHYLVWNFDAGFEEFNGWAYKQEWERAIAVVPGNLLRPIM